MKRQILLALLSASLISAPVAAGSLTGNSALGGALGGAIGAFVGSELGGTTGATLGGAIGGATGAAIATQGYQQKKVVVYDSRPVAVAPYYAEGYEGYPRYRYRGSGYFCPPGQAKKGRC